MEHLKITLSRYECRKEGKGSCKKRCLCIMNIFFSHFWQLDLPIFILVKFAALFFQLFTQHFCITLAAHNLYTRCHIFSADKKDGESLSHFFSTANIYECRHTWYAHIVRLPTVHMYYHISIMEVIRAFFRRWIWHGICLVSVRFFFSFLLRSFPFLLCSFARTHEEYYITFVYSPPRVRHSRALLMFAN